MKVHVLNIVTAPVNSDATGAVDTGLVAWPVSSSPCEGYVDDKVKPYDLLSSIISDNNDAPAGKTVDNGIDDVPLRLKGGGDEYQYDMDILYNTGTPMPIIQNEWPMNGRSLIAKVLRIRGGAGDEGQISPSVNPRKRKKVASQNETPEQAIARHLDEHDELVADFKAEVITMIDKTRIGKKWQDSLIDLVDRMASNTRGVFMETSIILGKYGEAKSELEAAHKSNISHVEEICQMRMQIQTLKEGIVKDNKVVGVQAKGQAGVCSCSENLEPVLLDMRNAICNLTKNRVTKFKSIDKDSIIVDSLPPTPDNAGAMGSVEPVALDTIVLSDSETGDMATTSYAKATRKKNVKDRLGFKKTAPKAKSNNMVEKKTQSGDYTAGRKKAFKKFRMASTDTRLNFTVPTGMTIAQAKTDIWQTVKGKIANPRAKTFARSNQITIIPDDDKTFEVIRQLPGVQILGPRSPRVIIYDVDVELSVDDITQGLVTQNPELGLTTKDIETICFKHKLVPRTGSTAHWVIEVPAKLLPKLENKAVFLGLTRCKVKLHQNLPQCYNCQAYGHTSLKCTEEIPRCRHCAKAHNSRDCTEKEKSVCTNSSSNTNSSSCKFRDKAIKSLLRRTDFSSK